MLVGYMRVSTDGDRQVLDSGCCPALLPRRRARCRAWPRRAQRRGSRAPITMDQMLAATGQGLQIHPKLVWVSTKFLGENEVSPRRDMPVWIPSQGETFGFGRRDIRRAIAAGLTYRPLPITAGDSLAWLRTSPERQLRLRAGLASEREADLLTMLNA
jgi:hypothetical protein